MRISKKILAIALSILMAVSMMPFTVFANDVTVLTNDLLASDTYSDSNYVYLPAGEYVLGENVTITDKIVVPCSGDVVLDMGGHDLSMVKSSGYSYVQVYDSSLTVKGDGNITTTGYSDNGSLFVLYGNDTATGTTFSELTIDNNVNITTQGYGILACSPNYANDCVVNIKGGSITAGNAALGINGNVQPSSNTVVNISGGTLTGETAIYAAGYATWNITGGTLTGKTGIYAKSGQLNISAGATVIGNGEAANFTHNGNGYNPTGAAIVVENAAGYSPNLDVNITGGTFESTQTSEAVQSFDYSSGTDTREAVSNFVSGGTFIAANNVADELPAEYLAEGATQTNGTVTQTYVAKVGNDYYATIEDAIAAAQDGDTITVLDDVVVTSPIVVPANKDVKLDVNGYSISGNIADADGKKLIQVSGKLEFVGSNGGCIYNINVAGQGHAACQALTGGTVIVNAPVTFGDSDTNRTNANAVNRGCGIQNNGGTLIINNGYFTAIDANYSTGAWAYAILNCAGDTTINNATVYGNNLHGALGCEEGTLTVNDGSFTVSGANNYYSLYCDGGSITVNGGTFNDNSKYGVNYVGENSSTTITGGDFTYSATTPFVQSSSKSNPVVSGGTYSAVVPADCCAPGFVPVTEPNAQGKYEVAKDTSDSISITTADEIDVNLYFGETGEEATVEYTFNTTPDIQQDTQGTKVVDFDSLPEVAGKRKLTIRVAPAQIRDNIDIVIKNAQGGVLRSYENYSVAEYCDQLAKGNYSENIKTLAKSVLDYGKAAANFFGYNEYAFTNQAVNFNNFEFDTTGWTAVADRIYIEEVRYVATSVPSLRFKVDMSETYADTLTATTDKGYKAKFVKVGNDVILQVTGIPASKLGETITVSVKDAQEDEIATIQYTPIIYAYNASKADNAELARLGKTIGQYSAAAKAVFA